MTSLRILSGPILDSIVSPEILIDRLESCFIKYSKRETLTPQRTVMWVKNNWWGVMSAYIPEEGVGVKIVSVIPANREKGLPTISGIVVLLDEETGLPKAVMDGAVLTGLRTAAASAISVRHLKPKDEGVLSIIGAGYQAKYHLKFIETQFKIEKLKIYDLKEECAQNLSRYAEGLGISNIYIAHNPTDAVGESDIVVETSTTETPVIFRESLKERVHIVSIGAHTRRSRAIEDEVIADAKLIIVDSREATYNETGDIYQPLSSKLVDPDRIIEIGEFLSNKNRFQISETGITIYKSVGIAVEDVCTASLAFELAESTDTGAIIDL